MTPFRRAFTLIEILVVVVILSSLMAIATPVITLVQRQVKVTATQAVMKKVDTALRLFKTDFGVYPGRLSYPDAMDDLSQPQLFNRLFYHVGTRIASADRAAIMADAQAGAGMFASPATTVTHVGSEIVGEPRADWNAGYRNDYAILINRMAREQARLAAVSGNLWLPGPVLSPHSGTSATMDKRAMPVFTAAASIGRPGWANDYLRGDIERRHVSGDSILDAWGRPLVYICQALPGIGGQAAIIKEQSVTVRQPKRYGLGPIGFDPNTGPGPALGATRPHLLYGGRITLSTDDAGDLQPTPTDPVHCPDLSNLKRSDIRYFAAPGYATEFELWSCGRDARFAYMRDEAVNADNVSVVPYLKGL